MNDRRIRPRHLIRAVLLAIVVPSIPPMAGAEDPAPRKAAQDDLKKLQGTWQCVAMEREGDPIPPEDLKGSTATYEDDRITLTRDGQVFRQGIVTLDPSKTPSRVNTWDLNGPYEDQTVPGIYEVAGDTLKLCFSRPGSERPARFTTKEGSGTLYCVYKRMKPQEKRP
jgi:uncharacterized protein (TIGR03067 family)